MHLDSELGSWTASEWRPRHLAAAVERFWHSEGTTPLPRERLLPNGLLELAVTLAEPHRLVEDTGSAVIPTASVSGLLTGPRLLEHPARHRVLGIRLRPAGAYALLGVPMRELSGALVDLRDLVGRSARELAERCQDTPSVAERFRLGAAWIAARLAHARPAAAEIAWSAAQIEGSAGRVAIGELRARTGWSKTRLIGTFREQIGVAPKMYARIVRFRRACTLLDDGEGALADVALAAGYYDQPHMNGEFRALSGLTPRQFLASRYPGGSTAMELAD